LQHNDIDLTLKFIEFSDETIYRESTHQCFAHSNRPQGGCGRTLPDSLITLS